MAYLGLHGEPAMIFRRSPSGWIPGYKKVVCGPDTSSKIRLPRTGKLYRPTHSPLCSRVNGIMDQPRSYRANECSAEERLACYLCPVQVTQPMAIRVSAGHRLFYDLPSACRPLVAYFKKRV